MLQDTAKYKSGLSETNHIKKKGTQAERTFEKKKNLKGPPIKRGT